MIELHLEYRVYSFDGRVIEYFGERDSDSVRRHVAHIKVAELSVDKKGRYELAIRMKGGSDLFCRLPPEAIEQAQKLVAEVERVRASL